MNWKGIRPLEAVTHEENFSHRVLLMGRSPQTLVLVGQLSPFGFVNLVGRVAPPIGAIGARRSDAPYQP